MSEIIPLLLCLTPLLTGTSLKQMSHTIFAMLCISGRVTTLGLSRWNASERYWHETIKLLPVSPDPDLIADLERKVLFLGAIHRSKTLHPAA